VRYQYQHQKGVFSLVTATTTFYRIVAEYCQESSLFIPEFSLIGKTASQSNADIF
jgi:hypothetical protein